MPPSADHPSYQWGGIPDPDNYNTGFMASVYDALGQGLVGSPVGASDRNFENKYHLPAMYFDPIYQLLTEHRDDRDKYFLADHLCSCDEMVEDHAAHLTEVLRAYLRETHEPPVRVRQRLRHLADRALAGLRIGKA